MTDGRRKTKKGRKCKGGRNVRGLMEEGRNMNKRKNYKKGEGI